MKAITGALTAGLLALQLAVSSVSASSLSSTSDLQKRDSSWWFATIDRQGAIPFGGDSTNYKVFRNVQDYGAKGDGVTDDTAAINSAITDGGNRCGLGCDSSTTTPAIVYLPPGTYLISSPIQLYYDTHLVGDFETVPTLKGASNFVGVAIIDSDPKDSNNNNWWTNQNNFYRQVRNFKIDLTGMGNSGTGIHWQVAQATSLQNIEFDMNQDQSDANLQQGIWMDNGSGGFMTDLVFNGGKFGMWVGNQQFTTKNLTFNNAQTAIYMNWNWIWTFSGVTITGSNVGIDMTAADGNAAGQVIVLDSKISATTGILTLYDKGETGTNGTLIIDNVDFAGTQDAVKNSGSGTVLLPGGSVSSYQQGRIYNGADSGTAVSGTMTAPKRPAALVDGNGNFAMRSKPQYDGVSSDNFVSVKSKGAKGDGTTDDTAAIQSVLSGLSDGQIAYIDYGAYVISDTVTVPAGVKIVGEVWPMILAKGDAFNDESNPKPMFQVGQDGDSGDVEISDVVFGTIGPQPGAILLEWNLAGSAPGASGLWDVHFRVGGFEGSGLQSDSCPINPNVTNTADPNCIGSFLLLHVTTSGSIYMENVWGWVADHELDLADHNKVNIYNGRGFLFESTKGAWLWGTAAEHSQMVNYNFVNAQNIFGGVIQSETAYMQGNPDATTPFKSNSKYGDPDFSSCASTDSGCARTWGLRVEGSSDIYIYGAGLYSFFSNYSQDCDNTNNCQENMISVDDSSVNFYGMATKAAVNMLTLDGKTAVLDSDNRNVFCAAVAGFTSSAS